EERHAGALHAAHGHGVALGRAPGELPLELGPAARVLVAVGIARRAGAVELGHRRHSFLLDALREGLALRLEALLGLWIGAATPAARGDHQRRRLAGIAYGELEARRGAHRQAAKMRLGDAERLHEVGAIVSGPRLAVLGDVVGLIGRRPAAR